MPMRFVLVACVALCSATFAAENSFSERTIGMEAFLKDAGTYGIEQEWPSLVVYNRQGLCAYRGVVDAKWDEARLVEVADRKEAQKGCDLIAGGESGSSKPQASDHRLVLLYVLDAPFCDNCRMIESELRSASTPSSAKDGALGIAAARCSPPAASAFTPSGSMRVATETG